MFNRLDDMVSCPECEGLGILPNPDDQNGSCLCSLCKGKGVIMYIEQPEVAELIDLQDKDQREKMRRQHFPEYPSEVLE